MFKFRKQPNEEFPFSVDFTDVLETSEILSERNISAIKESDGSDATSTVINSSDFTSGNKGVKIKVEAGTSGINYIITALVTSDAGNIFEADIKMTVFNE